MMRQKWLVCILFVLGGSQWTWGKMLGKELGWLRVCDQANFEVEAEQCPHGSWLSSPTPTKCVCLNGLWAVASQWCDEDYSLFLGQGHCFQLNSESQKMMYLGDPLEPFAPRNLMTKRNGHVFKPFVSSISLPYEYERNFYDHNLNKTVVRLLPPPTADDESKSYFLLELQPFPDPFDVFPERAQLCVKLPPPAHQNTQQPMLHLYKMREAIKTLRIVEECPEEVVVSSLGEVEGKMSLTEIKMGQGVHVKSGRILSKHCEFCDSSTHKRIKRSKEKSDKELNAVTGPTDEERQRLVNEETLRIIRTEVMFILDREKPPKHSHLNWQLLQRAKEAFTKVCPQLEVPKFLVNSLLRLFRFLYIHSKDSNPYTHFFEEGPQALRISQALDACVKDAAPLKFKYAPEKVEGTCALKNMSLDQPPAGGGGSLAGANGTAGNGTEDAPAASEMQMFCKCNDQLDLVSLNYTKNASNPNQLFNLTRDELQLPDGYNYTLIPPSEKFNGSYHDFPIETTWKIISFAHYYCAKYFKERPADHSAMLMKFETFFNADVVYRWGHPGLTTNETWQNLYNNFNLEKFANSVDACVASAKQVSDYPEWISRPNMQSVRRRKRSLEGQQVSPSSAAYCLQDPWDPVHKLGVQVKDQCHEWNSVL